MGFFDKVDEHEATLARGQNDHVVGIVSDRKNDPTWGPVCRYTLPDQDNKVTGWIPIGQKSCVGVAQYHLPRIGERMLIQKLGNGAEDAIATHALYSVSVAVPPQASIDNHHSTFDDGSTFTVAPGSGIHLVATNALSIDADGAITINGNATLSISHGANITITAPTINLNGVTIDSSGNVSIPGTLTVVGAVTFQDSGTIQTHLQNLDGSGGGS